MRSLVRAFAPVTALAPLDSGSVTTILRIAAAALLLCIYSNAANSNVVGFIISGKNATIAGRSVTAGRTLVSGESIQVGDGSLMLAVAGGKLTLNHDTRALFQRSPAEVLAVLDSGGLSFDQPEKHSELQIRSGNLSIRPNGALRTLAAVEVTPASLIVATRLGSVRVDGGVQPLDVVAGKALKFALAPDAADPGPQAPSSTPASSTGPSSSPASGRVWSRLIWCGLAGAAVGSVPLLVSEQTSASPTTSLGWAIPGGAIAGGLLCEIGGGPPPPPPPPQPGAPVCALTALPQQNPGAPPQIGYTSANATNLALAPPRMAGTAAPQPPAGVLSVYPTGPRMGGASTTYSMTATGPGGPPFVCKATVSWDAPTCSITASPTTVQAGQPVTLQWTSSQAVAPATLRMSGTSVSNPSDQQVPAAGSLVLNPAASTNYRLVVKGPGGTRTCPVFVRVATAPTPPPVTPPCTQEFEEMNFAFRFKMGMQGVSNILTVASLGFAPLPGLPSTLANTAGGQAVILSTKVHLYGGKAVAPSFEQACFAYAQCAVKNGLANGGVEFYNAGGRAIGKCTWNPNGAVAKTFGWGHAIGLLDW